MRAWFDRKLLSRLNPKSIGRIISTRQRLHHNDLTASMLEKGYQHITLPGIAKIVERVAIGADRFHLRWVDDLLNSARENQAMLDQLRRDQGPVVFSAQY